MIMKTDHKIVLNWNTRFIPDLDLDGNFDLEGSNLDLDDDALFHIWIFGAMRTSVCIRAKL